MTLSKRQLSLRRDAIGGSEIAVLAGLSKWATPIELWESKVLGTEKEETDPMLFGVAFEEPIAQVYAKKKGAWLKQVNTLINGKYPLAVATPDRAVFSAPRADLARMKKLGLAMFRESDLGLEIKSANWRQKDRWGPEGSDYVPDEYAAQCTWCMGVTGKEEWDLAVLFDRDDFRIYHLRFDAEFFGYLYELAERFMREHVIPKKPPPVDASENYTAFLERRWERNSADLVRAPEDIEALVFRFAAIGELDRRIYEAKKLVGNTLRAAVGEGGGFETQYGKLFWRREKDRQTVDHEAMATEAITIAGLVIQSLPAGERRAELEQQLRTLKSRHTTTTPGNRPLKFYGTKEFKALLSGEQPNRLADMSDAFTLPDGTKESTDE